MEIRKRKPIGKKAIKCIEKLYEAYSKKLFYIAKNCVKDNNLAEDVVQNVFEKILKYPEGVLNVSDEEAFYFLITITKNEAYSILKYEKSNEHESLTYEDGGESDFIEDPRDNYLQMLDLESLKRSLAAMSRKHRNVLLFRYVYGLKCKEIAGLIKITERSVKSRCSEAREQLKRMLEEEER